MAQPGQMSSLTFYLLPCTWMTTCLSFLLGQTDQRPALKIENASLLLTGEVSDEEQEETHFYESRGRDKAITLRRDLEHERDYYCVGSNVWNLVSEKFGFDEELGYKVVSQQPGVLAVNLGTEKIPIPATGRFDYQPVARKPTDVVSDEEDDDLVRLHIHVHVCSAEAFRMLTFLCALVSWSRSATTTG